MPAGDDGPVDGQPTQKDLIEIAMKALSALGDALALNRQLLEHREQVVDQWSQRNGIPAAREADLPESVSAGYRPQNPELREYDSCRKYYQALEAAARRDLHLPNDVDVTKEMIYRAGGPSPKTTTRIMTLAHGLLADQWPPSTWPEEAPNQG
jgi:hypothetical protein